MAWHPPGPQEEANATLYLEQQRAQMAEKQRREAADRAVADRTAAEQQFNTKLDSAYNSGLGYAQSRLGGTYDNIKEPLTAAFQRQKQLTPMGADPNSYFSNEFIDSSLNGIRDNRRQEYGRTADQLAGNGFANKIIDDKFDDTSLSNIYNEQYGNANDQLHRAYARGNLSPIGMSLAQKQLDTQGKAGMSHLQDLGGSVLGKYRGELSGIGDELHQKASGYNLGDTFDTSSFNNSVNDKKNEFGQRLEGDLRDATKGENLFNVDEIVGKAGVSQGLYNPASSASNINSSPIMDALGARKKRNTSASAGAF